MAKKKKAEDVNNYWVVKEDKDSPNKVYIYTTRGRKPKTDCELIATYMNIEGKMIARQYMVTEGTEEHDQIVEEFGLTDKDRIIERRKRRSSK